MNENKMATAKEDLKDRLTKGKKYRIMGSTMNYYAIFDDVDKLAHYHKKRFEEIR